MRVAGKGPPVDRIKPRNKEQEQWLADTANALAQAEYLTARLMDLRGTGDLAAVMAIKAEIAILRLRVEAMEREGDDRREFDPDWSEKSAWCAPGKPA
jgi:hypothetical protein